MNNMSWFIAYYNYFTAPATIITIIGGTWFISGKVSSLQTRFEILEKKFEVFEKRVEKIERAMAKLSSCIVEIQTFLKSKFVGSTFMELVEMYGVMHSPMVLKDEFRPLIQESGIDTQIETHRKGIVKWLTEKNPATGLDAQRFLLDLVTSDEISTFIDTTELKKMLYEKGKTSKDYFAILTVYLFETIIPEVIKD